MLGSVLRGLTRRHLNTKITSNRAFDVEIVERPGLWMEPDALSDLSARLRTVAGRTLNEGELTYGVFSGEAERLSASIITLVSDKEGKPIAFNALAVMEVEAGGRTREVLHLGLVMVDPDARSGGLSWVLYGLTCFLLFFRNQFRPLWISNVTQVPAVVGMVGETFSEVFPTPKGARRSLRQLILAREIVATHSHVFGVGEDARFDEDRFVIENAYTGGSDDLKKSWDEAQKHRAPEVNTFCEAELNYDRGDDFIQIGQMDTAAMRSFLVKQVPGRAVLSVLVVGSFVAIQRLVLPVIHWLDASRTWKTLRPAAEERP